jgi:hypothetical protein
MGLEGPARSLIKVGAAEEFGPGIRLHALRMPRFR